MITFVENLLTATGTVFKRHLSAFCDTVAADQNVAYAIDSSLLSFIKVNGGFELWSEEEQLEKIDIIEQRLGSFLKNRGHIIDACFKADPDASTILTEEIEQAWSAGAKALGVNIDDIIEGKTSILKKYLRPETNIWAIWTTPVMLTAEEFEEDLEEKQSKGPPLGINHAQTDELGLPTLQNTHNTFVNAVSDTLRAAHIDAEIIRPVEGLEEALKYLYPHLAGANVQPIILGDERWYREEERAADDDCSGFLPPPISEQLFPQDGQRLNTQTLRCGSTLWSYVDLMVAPKQLLAFNQLVEQLNRKSTPWRVKIQIAGGEPAGLEIKQYFAFAFQRTSDVSLRLSKAIINMDKDRKKGITRVSFRASFATWAPVGQHNLLAKRLTNLHGAIKQWGDAKTGSHAGDVAEGVMSSALGISPKMTSPIAAPRLQQALRLMPIFQPACPFDNGMIMFRTKHGSPWPYEVAADTLTRFFNILIGESGLGKSALLNSITFAAILGLAKDGNMDSIPYVGILDVGSSSKGLVDAIREQLPDHRQHLVAHFKLRNTIDYAVNMFDTPLGLRHPLPEHKAFLSQFLGAIFVHPDDAGSKNIQRLLSILVDEVYKLRAKKEPLLYTPGRVSEIDELLIDYNIDLPDQPRWWDVVDALFEEGLHHEAILAQRYAVPTMPDIAKVLEGERISPLLQNISSGSGTPLKQELHYILSTEASNFEMLWNITQFDYSDARILSLDLQDIIPRAKGEVANRTAEVMYMAGRQIVAAEIYMQEGDFDEVAMQYRAYHKNRIMKRRAQMSILNYDEFQRTRGRPYVREMVTSDGRESRKYNVHVNLASQFITDFDPDTLANASGIFIMGAEDEKVLKAVTDRLSLTKESMQAIKYELHGPTADGAPFIGIFKTKKGRYEQTLWHNMSPQELWMLTTTTEDMVLKEMIVDQVGFKEARRLLSIRFPSGSAKKEILSMKQRAAHNREASHDDIYKSLVKGMLESVHAA